MNALLARARVIGWNEQLSAVKRSGSIIVLNAILRDIRRAKAHGHADAITFDRDAVAGFAELDARDGRAEQ